MTLPLLDMERALRNAVNQLSQENSNLKMEVVAKQTWAEQLSEDNQAKDRRIKELEDFIASSPRPGVSTPVGTDGADVQEKETQENYELAPEENADAGKNVVTELSQYQKGETSTQNEEVNEHQSEGAAN